LPGASDPTSPARPSDQAEFKVVATRASFGLSFIWLQAIDWIKGTASMGQLPGLKSVARATAQPAVIIRRAGAYAARPSVKTVPGSRVAMVREPARAAMPASSMRIRWSAESAPSLAARAAPPKASSSSACTVQRRPSSMARCRMVSVSARSKTVGSQKTSQRWARPSATTVGRISSHTRVT